MSSEIPHGSDCRGQSGRPEAPFVPLPLQGFLYRALGLTLAMGLEADKVEVLLLELLYRTDYSNDFDREVKAPCSPLWTLGGCGMGTPAVVRRGVPAWPPWPAALPQPGRLSPQGVILCFGLCARGQVKTVLNVLHDFEERIQESEQSWQIGAWRVSRPGSTIRPPGAPQNSALRPQPRLLPGHRKKLPSVSPSAGEGGHWTQAAEGRPLEAASPGPGQQGAVPQAA